jgi:hypothetical protein
MQLCLNQFRHALRRVGVVADRIVTLFLAATLLLAAISKAINDESGYDFPVPLPLIVFFEVGAGLLLITQPAHLLSRSASASLFAVLGGFALFSWAQGDDSCRCFGQAGVAPGWMVAFDASACLWLGAGFLAGRHEPADQRWVGAAR